MNEIANNNLNIIIDNNNKGEYSMNNDTINKKVIIDLVNKIKYEVSEQQLAELAGEATPLTEAEFVDWHERIDELRLTGVKGKTAAQLRAFLHRVLDVTRIVGGEVVRIGRRIVRWILSMVNRFPNTMAAAIILAAVVFVVGSIPYLGPILMPIAELVGAVAILSVLGLEVIGQFSRTIGVNQNR